jgi:hypothetical protein
LRSVDKYGSSNNVFIIANPAARYFDFFKYFPSRRNPCAAIAAAELSTGSQPLYGSAGSLA